MVTDTPSSSSMTRWTASVRASLFSTVPPDTNHSPSTAITTTKQKIETSEQRSTATRCRTSGATSELRGTHRVAHFAGGTFDGLGSDRDGVP